MKAIRTYASVAFLSLLIAGTASNAYAFNWATWLNAGATGAKETFYTGKDAVVNNTSALLSYLKTTGMQVNDSAAQLVNKTKNVADEYPTAVPAAIAALLSAFVVYQLTKKKKAAK